MVNALNTSMWGRLRQRKGGIYEFTKSSQSELFSETFSKQNKHK